MGYIIPGELDTIIRNVVYHFELDNRQLCVPRIQLLNVISFEPSVIPIVVELALGIHEFHPTSAWMLHELGGDLNG